MRVQQPGQRVIHGIGIAALSQALGAQLVEGCFCQPILCRRHRQLAACGQIVHPQDEPSRFFGTAAAGALAVVDITQRPEQDTFVGMVDSIKEISEMTKTSEATVKSRIHRAWKLLLESFDE